MESGRDIRLSKLLSFILRHGAHKEHIAMDSGGFVKVEDLLKHKKFSGFGVEDIKRVVEINAKQRFLMRTDSAGILQIRANQGHSVEVEVEMNPILVASEIPIVVHGTYLKNWGNIEKEGLKRMERNHIHFAIGIPTDKNVISGIRKNCNVYIYIDVERAIKDGYKFFRSANGVILCPGNEEGILPPEYFKDVKIVK